MTDVTAPDNPAAAGAPALQSGTEPSHDVQIDDAAAQAGGAEGGDSLADAAQDAADEGLDDFEHNGKTYKVPKELKNGYLRQADYTRKTQEVAERGRAHEAERANFAAEQKIAREFQADFGELAVINSELARYDKVDWNQWSQEDNAACTAAIARVQQLRDTRDGKVRGLTAKVQEMEAKERDSLSKRAAEYPAEIRKRIPDWSEAKAADVKKIAVEFGYTPEELQRARPQDVHVLHDAMMWRRHVTKNRAAAAAAVPADPDPVPTPKAGPSRAAPPRGPSDGDSIEAWMAKRNRQAAGR